MITDIESGKVKIIENGKVNVETKQKLMEVFKNEQKNIPAEKFSWSDKLEWMNADQAEIAGFRMCPGAWIRRGCFIAKNVILMPSFVNIGAYIDEGTMIDSGVTVGSCAQVGKNCHISSNVVLAGVLEPMQAMPVIVEDECFIGAGCVIAEGMKVSKNSALAAGCVLTASTRVYDRETGEYTVGKAIPENSVVVPGSYSSKHGLSVNCLIIVKTVSAETKAKTALNELLRN